MNDTFSTQSGFLDDSTDANDSGNQHWYMLLFAVAATFLAIYSGFLRPASRQLSEMRNQVSRLEKSVAVLTEQRESVEQTNQILSMLMEQGRRNGAAKSALNDLAQVHQQLLDAANNTHEAVGAIDKLVGLNSDIAKTADLAESTERALTGVNRLQERVIATGSEAEIAEGAIIRLSNLRDDLVASIDRMQETEPVLVAVDMLHQRLMNAKSQMEDAKSISQSLLELEEDLRWRGGQTQDAQLTLNELIDLRDQLDVEVGEIEVARDNVLRLLTLKNDVLDQGDEIAGAIESLERTEDLQNQFTAATRSFEQIRHMMTEIVMMEPTVERALTSLRPITELGNLRRLAGDELRYAAKMITDMRQSRLAKKTVPVEKPAGITASAPTESSTH